MSKTIGIVGTRDRNTQNDLILCRLAFDKIYEKGDEIVSGGCPLGGDRFAEVIAKERGLTITIHFPDWKGRGNSAGYFRNTFIANDSDILIAVRAKHKMGGTEDTIKKVLARGKEVIYV